MSDHPDIESFGDWRRLKRNLVVSAQIRVERAIDEHECHATKLAAPIGPRMIGAELNDDVAGLQKGLGFLQDKHNLAFQHDSIIDGFGSVHHGVRSVRAASERVSAADRNEVPERRGTLFLVEVMS